MQFWCLVQSIAVNQNLSPRGRVKTPTLIAGVAILTPIGFKSGSGQLLITFYTFRAIYYYAHYKIV